MASKPLTVGSTYRFQAKPVTKDGTTWNLSAATVQLLLRDPDGNVYTRNATVTDAANGVAEYVCTPADLNVPGTWTRRWKVTDGGVQITGDDIPFQVEQP
jgi:hypothetical protein